MPGIGIGISPHFQQKKSLLSYWKPLSLFFLDGSITDVEGTKYFVDKSTNGRNFLITGYDFASDWTTGFPYKSAATISAPAADAALIAADINNFLYDSEGAPNQIPVVSLFQDIDYEHKIFCKHAAQVVDGNGVETYEPRVSHIFMTTDVLTGADLTKAQTDFNVPTEVTADVLWVGKTGNDTTGDGSKAAPYLTIGKANTIAGNKTVYVKSGIYQENSVTTFTLLLNKTSSYYGLGLCTITKGGTDPNIVYLYGATTIRFEGFVANAGANTSYGIKSESANKSVKRCRVSGSTVTSYTVDANNISQNIIGIGGGLRQYLGGVTIKDSFFNFATTGSGLMGAGSETFTVINSRLIYSASGGPIAVTGAAIILKGNRFDLNTAAVSALLLGGVGNLTMTFNRIFSSTNITAIPFNIAAAATCAASIKDNVFNFTGTPSGSAITCIRIDDQSAPEIERNIFTSTTENPFSLVQIFSAGDTVGNATVKNNRICGKALTGYKAHCGSETSSANDDKITPEISSNVIFGPLYYDETKTGTTHGLFVGHNINAAIKHNSINGGLLGVVVKHTGGVFTSNGVTYNILKNCLYGVYIKGVDGLCVHNNTIISDTASETLLRVGIATETHTTEAQNIVIKNNIICIPYATNSYLINISNGAEVGLVSDYNIFYNPLGKKFRYQNANKSFAEWQALGFDTHSIMLTEAQFNALFTDFANEDYTLPAGSAAIGAGEALDAAYDDGLDASTNWGSDTEVPTVVTKQQGAAWDCGAYVH